MGIIHIGDPGLAKFLLEIDEDKMPDEETYKNLEKRIRYEIAEECRDAVYKEIDSITISCESREFASERILKIIRGD